MEKLKLGLGEIEQTTSESASVIQDAIRAGHLKTFVVGRRRFARPADVRRWIDFLERQSDAGTPVVYRARIAERTVARPASGGIVEAATKVSAKKSKVPPDVSAKKAAAGKKGAEAQRVLRRESSGEAA